VGAEKPTDKKFNIHIDMGRVFRLNVNNWKAKQNKTKQKKAMQSPLPSQWI